MSTSCGTVRLVVGPKGDAGNDGADGTDGVSAFTLLTAQFTMPAAAATANATVEDNTWMTPGNFYYLQGCGWLECTAVAVDGVTVTFENPETSSLYVANVAAGTVIAIGAKVVAAGIQGPAGIDGASGADPDEPFVTWTAPSAALTNEFDLGSLTTGLLRITVAAGVATPSTAADGTHYLSPTTGLEPADIGVTVQAFDAFLTSIAALGTVADRIIYTTAANTAAEATLTAYARTLLDDANAATARGTLGFKAYNYGILGSRTAVDVNVGATDTTISITATRYRIDKVMVDNGSISLTTATAGLFTAAGGGGTTIAADQALAALTATTKFDDLTLDAVTGTDVFTDNTLYFRVGTPQGAAATCDVYVLGWAMS